MAFVFNDNDIVTLVDINTNKNLLGGFEGDPTTEFLEEVLSPNESQDKLATEFQLIQSPDASGYFYIMTSHGQFLVVITDQTNPNANKVTWTVENPLSTSVADKSPYLFTTVDDGSGNPNQPLYFLYSFVPTEGDLHLFGNTLSMAVPNPDQATDPHQVHLQITVVAKGKPVGTGTSSGFGPSSTTSSSTSSVPAWVWVMLGIIIFFFIVLAIYILRAMYLNWKLPQPTTTFVVEKPPVRQTVTVQPPDEIVGMVPIKARPPVQTTTVVTPGTRQVVGMTAPQTVTTQYTMAAPSPSMGPPPVSSMPAITSASPNVRDITIVPKAGEVVSAESSSMAPNAPALLPETIPPQFREGWYSTGGVGGNGNTAHYHGQSQFPSYQDPRLGGGGGSMKSSPTSSTAFNVPNNTRQPSSTFAIPPHGRWVPWNRDLPPAVGRSKPAMMRGGTSSLVSPMA